MKRILTAAIAALAVLAVAVPVSSAAPSTATINVAFSSDFTSAHITSTKGVSNYEVVLCDGTTKKYELNFDTKSYTAGPFAAELLSIRVKSATTSHTFYSDFAGECKKTDPDPDPKG